MQDRRGGRIGVSLLLAVAGCGRIAIRTEQFSWVDPAALRTWAWSSRPQQVAPIGDTQRAGMVDWRVRRAIERGMAARRYAMAAPEAAGLVVLYRLSVHDLLERLPAAR